MPSIESKDLQKLNELKDKLLADKNFRAEFAKDPEGSLKKLGFKVPEGVLPKSIDSGELEQRVSALRAGPLGISQLDTIANLKNVMVSVKPRGTGPIGITIAGNVG